MIAPRLSREIYDVIKILPEAGTTVTLVDQNLRQIAAHHLPWAASSLTTERITVTSASTAIERERCATVASTTVRLSGGPESRRADIRPSSTSL